MEPRIEACKGFPSSRPLEAADARVADEHWAEPGVPRLCCRMGVCVVRSTLNRVGKQTAACQSEHGATVSVAVCTNKEVWRQTILYPLCLEQHKVPTHLTCWTETARGHNLP